MENVASFIIIYLKNHPNAGPITVNYNGNTWKYAISISIPYVEHKGIDEPQRSTRKSSVSILE